MWSSEKKYRSLKGLTLDKLPDDILRKITGKPHLYDFYKHELIPFNSINSQFNKLNLEMNQQITNMKKSCEFNNPMSNTQFEVFLRSMLKNEEILIKSSGYLNLENCLKVQELGIVASRVIPLNTVFLSNNNNN